MPWPADAAAVAGALAAGGADGADGAVPAWCWLDEWEGRSILGSAAEVRIAERGREREFLRGLRDGGREGWIVALGYELGVPLLGLDPAPGVDADAVAPAFALRMETALLLDHARGTAELRGPSDAVLDAWMERYGAPLLTDGVKPGGDGSCDSGRSAPSAQDDGRAWGPAQDDGRGRSFARGSAQGDGGLGRAGWRKTPAEYEAEVEACRAAIRDGDAYVLCLTDTAAVPAAGVDPLGLYLRLRGAAAGRAVRGGVLVAGERALVSASPERFLGLRDGRIATHPIKGTRPRGETPEDDARLAAELAADPKERAENLMIVDLMRNDLSRVCVPGTVATTGFLRVETHPHVHQLVSTVEGELLPGADAVDAIAACFPGGSMTGAPKRRAVEILAALEGAPRGLYAGCFGWIGRGAGGESEAELAMTIRGVELRGVGTPAAVALVGAGGGVTADSRPAQEEAEKRLKAAPLLAALGALSTEGADTGRSPEQSAR